MFAEVIVDISNCEVDKVFDYSIDTHPAVKKGSRVLVPFGNRNIEGYVINIKENSLLPAEKIKPVSEVIDSYPVINEEMFSLLEFMVKRYHLRIVDVLRLFIPAQMRGGKVKELLKQYAYLSEEFKGRNIDEFIKPSASSQKDIYYYLLENGKDFVSEINKNFSAAALRNLISRGIVLIETVEIKRSPYKEIELENKKITLTKTQSEVIEKINNSNGSKFLLHGVTGSGKTEVYMNCISKILKENKTAIMLVPEISLTPQVLRNFRSRFGSDVAILHSGLSGGERFDEWRRLISGEASVVVGARSAIFAPLKNVGLIIIDEEHDSSYVSESNPRYITHEVAQFRRAYNNCNIIMGSATPSIESYYKTVTKEYRLIEMNERINKRALPEIQIADMCKELYNGNNGIFSKALESALYECVNNHNQAIIFINRRGYSSYVLCKSCGYVAKCERCDVSLVYHREENTLKCHYCNNRYAMLDLCPNCKSPHIKQGYVGTEQVVEKLKKMFPHEKILRMDNDTTQNKDSHAKILGEFHSKKAAVLVGTQMIAKGHDFPDVTLVGIIDADMSLHFSDYRSAERTFQLITQVSGRAGRDNKTGKVILQTYSPHNYVFRYAVKNDYKAFYDKECNLREVTKYPPFSKIIRILICSEKEELASAGLKNLFDELTELQKNYPESFAYFAAMRAPVKKIQDKYRMQIIMRIVASYDMLIEEIYQIIDKNNMPKVSCFIEINPGNLS